LPDTEPEAMSISTTSGNTILQARTKPSQTDGI